MFGIGIQSVLLLLFADTCVRGLGDVNSWVSLLDSHLKVEDLLRREVPVSSTSFLICFWDSRTS